MDTKKPLVIYHRGRHGKGIRTKENTIEAFLRAVNEGAQMIECDVWDDLRVIHDPDSDAEAPTLSSVLHAIGGRSALNIEIKSPLALRWVLGAVEEALLYGPWTPKQIVVSSFHHETVIRVKQVFPNLVVGAVNDGVVLSSYIKQLRAAGVDNLHLEWVNVYMDMANGYAMREALRETGMHLWVWTVNTKKVFETVVRYGAEAVFTDKPQLFR